MKMKIMILILLSSFACSNNNKLTKDIKELDKLKTSYNSLNTQISTKGKTFTREELKTKKEEVTLLESKIQTLKKQIDDTPIVLTYKRDFVKPVALASFKMKEIVQLDKSLEIEVHYSGGCGDTHQFELITNGNIDQNGVLDFYLVDNTKGDNCKMLLMEKKSFDISKVASKSKITAFRINDKQLTTFARSK